MESIDIVIAPDGSLSYTVKGVKGSSCKNLTLALDTLSTVKETKTTAEYCQLPAVNHQKLGGG